MKILGTACLLEFKLVMACLQFQLFASSLHRSVKKRSEATSSSFGRMLPIHTRKNKCGAEALNSLERPSTWFLHVSWYFLHCSIRACQSFVNVCLAGQFQGIQSHWFLKTLWCTSRTGFAHTCKRTLMSCRELKVGFALAKDMQRKIPHGCHGCSLPLSLLACFHSTVIGSM